MWGTTLQKWVRFWQAEHSPTIGIWTAKPMDFAQVVGLGIQLLGGGFGIAIHEKFPGNGWVFQVLFMGIFHVCGDSPRVQRVNHLAGVEVHLAKALEKVHSSDVTNGCWMLFGALWLWINLNKSRVLLPDYLRVPLETKYHWNYALDQTIDNLMIKPLGATHHFSARPNYIVAICWFEKSHMSYIILLCIIIICNY